MQERDLNCKWREQAMSNRIVLSEVSVGYLRVGQLVFMFRGTVKHALVTTLEL
jgi:hypothetical protein